MVEFVTLLLGLVVGPHPVEVMVDDRVAAVELLLDGAAVGRLEKAPWVASVDFGTKLEPRELAAIAYDARGDELHRTAQAINRPRPRAEAQLLLERCASGQAVAARVSWQSTEEERPAEVLVTLDGESLVPLEPYTYALPALDPEAFHILHADVRFAAGGHAHATVAFGGAYLTEVSEQLTAVLVSLTGKERQYEPAELGGWFLVEGAPQSVVAVESGPVEVLIVRAEGVATATEALPGQPFSITLDTPQTALPLPSQYRLRALEPYAARADRGHLSFETFIISPDLSESGGVLWALKQRHPLVRDFTQPRLTDAVAVAGLQAALGNRRRAVVLVTVDDDRDFSTLRPAVVIDYLRRLQVPLFVWHLGARPGPSGWPKARAIATFKDLRRAVRDLESELSRQRVIWLEGANDPASIRLAGDAAADLAGPPL